MKRIVLLTLFILFYAISFSQETDTILYSDTECNESLSNSEMQNISIQFSNDTITVSGDIIANCCGMHFIKYEIINDSISLTRIDTGDMCDCYCLHNININIAGCFLDSYNIHLSEYYGNDGYDTIVNNNPTCVYNINNEEIKIFPNPASNSISIDIEKEYTDLTVEIIDETGRVVYSRNDLENPISLDNFVTGIYFVRLQIDGNVTTKKIVVE